MPEAQASIHHRFPSGFTINVSFCLESGVTALFGPSGSGKSSILRILAGMLNPAEGSFSVRDRVLLDTRRRLALPPERRAVGFVTQSPLLFPHLSVRQNILFGARWGRPGRRRADAGGTQVDLVRLVEILEISHLLDRRPATLSGGEAQRVALARAFHRKPDLLLLDEPFSALDQSLKLRVGDCLERLLSERCIPTIYVSHDQLDVRKLATRAIVLREGKIVAEGSTAEALDRTAILDESDPSGPMNLLRIENVRAVGDSWEGTIHGQTCLIAPPRKCLSDSARSVWVAFPPNAVTLTRSIPVGLSTRNHLRATVSEVVHARGRVFVLLDIGQRFWSELTPAAVRELELRPGMLVICLIKSSAMSPLH
jgi:molybdate transport system ATP-binding protein